MFCDCGSAKSSVINSRPIDNYVKRQRRCNSCGASFYTKEERVHEKVKRGRPPKLKPVMPVPDERGLYTPEGAVSLKMSKTLTRRKNEDRVSSYYIEDDYDY